MRVRAVAAPSNQSNAVGSVELECTPEGLLIVYLGVAAFSPGYAPAALTRGTTVRVPWTQVEEVRVGPNHVFLSLASNATPHSRLCLTHFSHETAPPVDILRRRRALLWFAMAALATTLGVGLGLQWTHWTGRPGAGAAFAVGVVAAIGLLLVGWFVDLRVMGTRVSSAELMTQWLLDVRHFRPAPVLVGPAPAPADTPTEWVDLIRYVPRSTLAVIIVLSAGALAFVLTTSWLVDDDRQTRSERGGLGTTAARGPLEAAPIPQDKGVAPPPPSATQLSEPSTVAALPPQPNSASSAATTPTESVTAGEACRCARAESALWSLEFPRLSTLLIEQRTRPHKEHQHLELELAVVNNGNTTLEEVNLAVQFYEDEGKTETRLRPLHYPGALRPGQAVKWSVEARATSFVVNNPLKDVLKQSSDSLAPADRFAELLNANHRPVRLHAAMMLAYLGDPRAKAGALRLREAFSELEMPYLDRVLATQGDLISCDWGATEQGRHRDVSACVFNVGSVPAARPGVKVRALDRVFDYRNPTGSPPLVIAEKVSAVTGPLPPGQGVRVAVSLDTDNADGKLPQAFEIFADNLDHL